MNESLDGTEPTVAESAFVSKMAYLIGDVTVDERSSVWPFVCCRADGAPVTIGAETNVQEFTMLHAATIGSQTTIGHSVVVDFATVEDHALVGMSSVVMRDAIIESNSIVAAGAVVRQGQIVPEGHLAYGVPAETTSLSDDQFGQITTHYERYVDRAQRYKQDGGFE